ncbi:MAG: hypothetical protein ACRYFB_04655 [Janthinobacterium lividum]
MLDALKLSICLTSSNFTDLKTAIGHYEKQMLERLVEATKMTLDNTE